MSEKLERRAAADLAVKNRRLVGYAARFNSETRIGGTREVIRPGAFSSSLRSGRDVLCLRDHDATALLGRTKSGSLRLEEDALGLKFELDVPDTQAGRDLLALAERGDLGGMSFGFIATSDNWAGDLRELREVDLREVSIVQAFPAYSQTSVEARSKRAPTANELWVMTCN